MLKVTKFFEMLHDKQAVGIPVREIASDETRYTTENQVIESWPIIQAYGLDSKYLKLEKRNFELHH